MAFSFRGAPPHRNRIPTEVRDMRFVKFGLLLLALAAAASAAAQEPVDWPREFAAAGGTAVVYQPQPETLEGDVLTARSAVSVTRSTDTEPRFGAVWFEALLDIDREERIAYFDSVHVTRVEFADEFGDLADRVAPGIEALGPELSMSLDDLLASLESGSDGQDSQQFKHKVPLILVAQEPTVLVVLDGPPQLRDLSSGIQQIVNSPYVILFDRAEGAYYLSDGRSWFRATDIMGRWQQAPQPSRTLVQLAEKVETSRSPGEETPEDSDRPYRVPRIVVSTQPAELIVFDGLPQYAALQGGRLLYGTNTESEVLIDIAAGKHYVLLAGRWYRGRSLDGPWSFVEPEDLPESFSAIPSESEKAALRAHVPGTEEAREAVLESQIPQTAAIKRSEARLVVEYDGAPQFEPVSGVQVAYAVNTPYSVLHVGHHYYACHNAVWFWANDPYGPWVVAEAVPQEIYLLPPSCPVYHVRYAYVYRATPEVIYVGYLPGYVGSYVYRGTVIYGTGWAYHPWVGTYYVPRPYTWGIHAHYTTWSGWSFGYSSDAWFWSYSVYWGDAHPWWPRTHEHYRFHEHGGWWGPGGYRHHDPGHRPTHRDAGRPRPARSTVEVYKRPEVATATRPGTVRARSREVAPTAPAPRPTVPRRAERVTGTRVQNDVVVDRKGNVFRRDLTGWQQKTPSGWTAAGTERPRARPVEAPKAPATSSSAPRPTPAPQTSTPRPEAPVPATSTARPAGFRPWAAPTTRAAASEEKPKDSVQRPRTPAPPKLQGPKGKSELEKHIQSRERGATRKVDEKPKKD